MKLRSALAVLPLLLAAAPGAAAQALDIREWPVPWADSRPRDPYVDGQGRVWFVGQVGNYVAYLQPGTGEFRRFELEDARPAAQPDRGRGRRRVVRRQRQRAHRPAGPRDGPGAPLRHARQRRARPAHAGAGTATATCGSPCRAATSWAGWRRRDGRGAADPLRHAPLAPVRHRARRAGARVAEPVRHQQAGGRSTPRPCGWRRSRCRGRPRAPAASR